MLTRTPLLIEYGPYGPDGKGSGGVASPIGMGRFNSYPFNLNIEKERRRMLSIKRRREYLQKLSNEWTMLELRDSCLDCVRKHLAQALVLMQEAKQGYPKHKWIAIGHLGEAGDEALKYYPELSQEIRKHRLAYMRNQEYAVPIVDLIDRIDKLEKVNEV